jgi:hypothetical protein
MKLYINAIFFLCIFGIFSCNLVDESENSSTLTDVEANDLLQATISQIAFNQTALPGRTAGIFVNYLNPGDGKAFIPYNIEPSSFDNFWNFAYYTGSLASAQKLLELAKEEANTDLEGIAQILLAYEYSNVTNTFGDIPFNDAIKGTADITPSYDSQVNVYDGIIELLDNAIELIENSGTNNSLSINDEIYNGDMTLWTKFAYGLKARTLYNLRNKNTNFDQQILVILESSFSNRSEQASFQFSAEKPNPLKTFETERPSTLFLSGAFGTFLQTNNDPRFLKYSTGDTINSAFFGFEWENPNSPLVWTSENTELPLLSYTEILFMEAEVSNHLNYSTDEISNRLRLAITSSMIENQLSTTAADVQDYISSFSNIEGLSSNEIHQRIMEQAYYAYYGYNFIQSWNNIRRTGIPLIENPLVQPSTYNPLGVIPVRFIYPESEFLLNSVELQEAMDRQNGALADKGLWVFE